MQKSFIAIVAALVLIPSFAGAQEKETICHATHSVKNPYVMIKVPVAKAFGHKSFLPHGAKTDSWPDVRGTDVTEFENCSDING